VIVSPIAVTGTVTNDANVAVNAIQAEVIGETWSVFVPLSEGQTLITASASDQYEQTASASITVNVITKGTITGTVTNSSGLPLESASVSITDGGNNVLTASTSGNGSYTIPAVASGNFTGTITKGGYATYNISGTISPGQTTVVNGSLNPVLPVLGNITVNNITADSATITWTTDQPSDSLVEYGNTTAYGYSASDSAMITAHSITLNGLAAATVYHFRIASTNSFGFSAASDDYTFTTQSPPSPITLTIASPSDGADITRSDVMVRGTVTNSTGNETGVVVNGIIADIYGNQFVANHLPLEEGANTITVTATDTAGNSATAAISVDADTTWNYITLHSNIESGISPLEADFRIDGSFSITSSNLNVLGPVLPEVISTGVDEYKLRFTTEGTYVVTASATGPDGFVYEDTSAITVMDKVQLDALLRSKWEGMLAALFSGDIENSVDYFISSSQERYRQKFAGLSSAQMDVIFSNIIDFKLGSLRDGMAECSALRSESGDIYSYGVTFVLDGDGIWKIMGF
jgi:hypothetical protein